MTDAQQIGIRNLLHNCAQVTAHDRVLIVGEDQALGWFDDQVPAALAEGAKSMGAQVEIAQVGAPTNDLDPDITRRICQADVTIFCARIGDQGRFASISSRKREVVSYVRTMAQMGSTYATADIAEFIALEKQITQILENAQQITIRCAKGTELIGRATAREMDAGARQRFPLGVHTPVFADQFSGQLVMPQYFTSTGSQVYSPLCYASNGHVLATIEAGKIAKLDGEKCDVAGLHSHFRSVGAQLGIDCYRLQSWHCGIHPGFVYDRNIDDDPDHWGNTAFVCPRYLHFHCGGTTPPGEVCMMLDNFVVEVDGTALWADGKFLVHRHRALQDIIAQSADLHALFPI